MTDPLKLEAVYYASPIPANAAVLTMMGLVFDKIYFPGVHFPTGGFDDSELKREIARLEGLTPKGRNTDVLIAMMKFVGHAKTLAGFCEFTGDPEHAFGGERDIPGAFVEELYDAIHGPRRPGWTPMFETASHKGIPGSDAFIAFPGAYHYLAGSILEAEKTGRPLIVDRPGLPVPGIDGSVPADDAAALSTLLAIHCTSLVLPEMAALSPEQLMEFRAENEVGLRHFRRAMLRHADELNARIAGLEASAIEGKTKFYVETQILPELDELRESLAASSRSWRERLTDAMQIVGEIVPACFASDPKAAIMLALMKNAPGFVGREIAAAGDKKAKRRSSDLYYLLQVERAAKPK